ncbi:MAG: L-erythro-3,5-diaminohexanoate dehydrogenase, partial [Acidimicrobiales bacterium]
HNLDATSFRQLVAAHREPEAVAAAMRKIVAARGKMHNPATSSGGVLVGRLTRTGAARDDGLAVGERVVPLASLIATPLRLDAVGPVDPADPQVPAAGRAVVTGRMSLAPVPPDLPLSAVLTAIDVYPAPSHTRDLARPGDHVVVLGAGHAGLAALAAAREAVGTDGLLTVVDRSEPALDRARQVAPEVAVVAADATRPVEVAQALARLGRPAADLTLLCTTVPGCEGTAILLTAGTGAVLFFSTATSFSAAALGADALSATTRLSIPNGYTPDRGTYLLDLLRRTPALLAAYTRPH